MPKPKLFLYVRFAACDTHPYHHQTPPKSPDSEGAKYCIPGHLENIPLPLKPITPTATSRRDINKKGTPTRLQK
jgi:hypothetical protein